jgi:hypothetical protein
MQGAASKTARDSGAQHLGDCGSAAVIFDINIVHLLHGTTTGK